MFFEVDLSGRVLVYEYSSQDEHFSLNGQRRYLRRCVALLR
jgi:hypothetical protein